ncbi:hypothetical protein [Corynebacterium gerontici]|uniref:Cardiolipin synthase N-terminal domain-containing protein n=1 Tax=Corynebacterium gerontici TaxID=2079234 RepID=A0A3G6J0H4_9CORY|nr:hypothetical protein [Corynebacterium gerontici]AZA11459.1 hypothetical protein CGERO_05760 [Corynebacterium gerontici]
MKCKKCANKTKWEDLSQKQKAGILVFGGVDLVAKLAAWHYLYHLPAEQIRGKKAWWVPITLINGVGSPAFLLFGRK